MLGELKTMLFISSRGRLSWFVTLSFLVQACVCVLREEVEGSGCPVLANLVPSVGAMAYSSFIFINLDEGAIYCCAYLFH